MVILPRCHLKPAQWPKNLVICWILGMFFSTQLYYGLFYKSWFISHSYKDPYIKQQPGFYGMSCQGVRDLPTSPLVPPRFSRWKTGTSKRWNECRSRAQKLWRLEMMTDGLLKGREEFPGETGSFQNSKPGFPVSLGVQGGLCNSCGITS